MHNSQESLGARIRRLRTGLEISKAELARRAGVDSGGRLVSHWEADAGSPHADTIPDLAGALGVSCDYLLKGEPDA